MSNAPKAKLSDTKLTHLINDNSYTEILTKDGHGNLQCSFCGKSQKEVKKLIAGPTVYICDECIGLCNDIIAEEIEKDEQAVGSEARDRGLKEIAIGRDGRLTGPALSQALARGIQAAGVDVIDARHAHPLGNDPEAHAVGLLARVGAVARLGCASRVGLPINCFPPKARGGSEPDARRRLPR